MSGWRSRSGARTYNGPETEAVVSDIKDKGSQSELRSRKKDGRSVTAGELEKGGRHKAVMIKICDLRAQGRNITRPDITPSQLEKLFVSSLPFNCAELESNDRTITIDY